MNELLYITMNNIINIRINNESEKIIKINFKFSLLYYNIPNLTCNH